MSESCWKYAVTAGSLNFGGLSARDGAAKVPSRNNRPAQRTNKRSEVIIAPGILHPFNRPPQDKSGRAWAAAFEACPGDPALYLAFP